VSACTAAVTVANPCQRCGGSSWLGVLEPCPDCHGNACALCGARSVIVWHVAADGLLTQAEARCWEHRHLRRDAIQTRAQLRAACAVLCRECDESQADYPRVARFRGAYEGDGWHHVCEEEASEDSGWIVSSCDASAFRDQVDPKGEIEGEPGTYEVCPCPCHADGGPWILDGCAQCEDDDNDSVFDRLLDMFETQHPGRCLVGAAVALFAERDGLRKKCEDQDAELVRLRELAQELDGRRQEAEADARRLRSVGERLQADVARLRSLVDTDDDIDEGE